MITLDTSAVFAILNRDDRAHDRVVAALYDDEGPYIIPAGVLAEIAYLTETRLGTAACELLLTDIEVGGYAVHWDLADIAHIRTLVRRYADMSLGFADAAVIVCAERYGGAVLTLDRRHFDVVSRENPLRVLPK